MWNDDDMLIAIIASHFSTGKSAHGRDVLDAGVIDQDVAGAGLLDQRPALAADRHVGLDVARVCPGFLSDFSG